MTKVGSTCVLFLLLIEVGVYKCWLQRMTQTHTHLFQYTGNHSEDQRKKACVWKEGMRIRWTSCYNNPLNSQTLWVYVQLMTFLVSPPLSPTQFIKKAKYKYTKLSLKMGRIETMTSSLHFQAVLLIWSWIFLLQFPECLSAKRMQNHTWIKHWKQSVLMMMMSGDGGLSTEEQEV